MLFEDSTSLTNELLTEINDSMIFNEIDLSTNNNISEPFQIISTQRGKRKLLLDGYIYRLDRANDRGVEQWRCSKKSCRGRIHVHQSSSSSTTNLQANVTLVSSHSHPAEPSQCEAAMLVDHIRSSAQHNPHQSPKEIVNRFLHCINDETAANLPSMTAMQRSIQRRRQHKKAFEISFDHEQQIRDERNSSVDHEIQIIHRSLDDVSFSSHQTEWNSNQILILAEENLNEARHRLGKASIWLCTTLNDIKNEFIQSIFIIQILDDDNETFLPLIYALFASNSSEFYSKFLDKILPGEIPKCILTNLDSVLIESLNAFYRRRSIMASIKICTIFLYHELCKSLQKRSINNDEHKSLKYLLTLAFIPQSEIVMAFENLQDLCSRSIDSIYDKFEDLCVGRLRPHGQRSRSIFHFQLWNWIDTIEQFENLFVINGNIKQWNDMFRTSIFACSHRNPSKIVRTIQQLHQHQLHTKNRHQQTIKTTRILQEFYFNKFKEIVDSYSSLSFEDFLVGLIEYLPI